MARRLLVLALATIAFVSPASPQNMYRGYDIGPDYGRMVQDMQREGAALDARIAGHQQQIVTQVLQNPQFQAMYRQHLAAGGRVPAPVFAYYYAATRGFTPEGVATFQQTESRNRTAELNAIMGLRAATAARGDAQAHHREGFHGNNAEFGRTLVGQSTYVAQDGRRFVLTNTTPGQLVRDPSSGAVFRMNPQGQYFMRVPHGWVPMSPTYGR